MGNGRPSISLCMIAKDEEAFIGQAIDSVRPIVSQIIVVDTGSQDKTVAIAREHGADVHHMPWNGDFSAPRNHSLKLATGDWILVLDADEMIDAADHSKLLSLTSDRRKTYKLTQRHYTDDPRISNFLPCMGEHPQWERNFAGYFESSLVRLFPNNDGIEYIGRVHELVEHSIQALGRHQIIESEIRIHHYGQTSEVRARKNKGDLYTPLGEAKLTDDPSHWQSYFELGVEHNVNDRKRESVDAFLKSIEMNPYYVSTWVNLGYVYCELGMYRESLQALQNALKLDSKSYEACCNIGVVFLRTGDFRSAEKYLLAAVTLNPQYVNAMSNLAKALTFQGRLAEAVHFLKRALDLVPQSSVTKMEIGIIYLAAKQYEVAERWLSDSRQAGYVSPLLDFHLAQIYKATGRVNQALDAFKQVLNIAAGQQPDSNLEGLLVTSRQEVAALEAR